MRYDDKRTKRRGGIASLEGRYAYATTSWIRPPEPGMRTRSLLKRSAVSPEDRVRRAIANEQFAEAVRMALELPDQPDLLFEAVKGRLNFWLASGQTEFAVD